jgi:DNA polymerase III epsilon subunit-like protein
MSLDFTAIDFETANNYRGSPCSVGLVKVRDGQVVDEAHWLIRPPEAFDYFTPFNTRLHGISSDTVASSPRWKEILPHLISSIGGDVVVAHNAGFDIGVIRYACIADAIHWPTLDFLCTLVLSRHLYSLPSYRLPFVAAQAGVILNHHHNAHDDALASAQITLALASQQGCDNLEDLARSAKIHIGHMETGTYRPSASIRSSYGLIEPNESVDAQPDHPFYDRVLVFTGGLTSMTRQEAWEQVAKVGGIPEPSVTKRTNILVAGDINLAMLAPGTVTTGKAAKAFALQKKGQDIELMTEDDFLRAL